MARIRLREWALNEGLITLEAYEAGEKLMDQDAFVERVDEIMLDGVCPALCDECGDVEPDGACEHGCPSVLIALGVI